MTKDIYSFIHDNLRKMLIATLGITFLLVLGYFAYSYKQTQTQASRLVMDHVARLAKAGVDSQNVNEIDNAIGSFAQTWKETQTLDLRIDLFLDGRKISHAGQLQPFQYLQSSTEENIKLPSGDDLRINIQFDLTKFIGSGFLFLLGFVGAILCLFRVLSGSMKTLVHSVTAPLESKVETIRELANNLPESARNIIELSATGISEIDDLGRSIGILTKQIVHLEQNLAQINFDKGRVKTAEIVAHNIKGAISVLQLRANKLPSESGTAKSEILECIQSLRDVSADLLKPKREKKTEFGEPAPAKISMDIVSILNAVVDSKRAEYQKRDKVQISLKCLGLSQLYSLGIPSTDLQTVISNLIDNSFDAIETTGKIKIYAKESDGKLEISVDDNGKGVPKHILPSLMQEGFSYGKEDGNGIGLAHARESVMAAQGTIKLTSEENKGTSVLMRLPTYNEASTSLPIRIPKGCDVICVDDDPLVHFVYKNLLKQFENQVNSVVSLHSASEFENWIQENGSGNYESRFYFFDYDLKDDHTCGLDLVEHYGLALESILVSGRADDLEISKRAARMGVRCITKDKINSVPIEVIPPKDVQHAVV